MSDEEIKQVLVATYECYDCKNGCSLQEQRVIANIAATELIIDLPMNKIKPLIATLCMFCMFGAPCSTTKDSQI